jgi:hypothetical protein
MLGLHNYTAQIQRLTALTEQLQQKVDDMDTKSMERMHSAISSTRQAVSDVREAVQRVFTHTNSTGGKLDTLLSKSGIVNLGTTAAAPVGSAAASASPSPAPRVKRLVVSMSSFPGRAELAIPTVYSIMYGKRVPDALYFWVAVNVSRLPGHDAAQEVPGPVKSVADQFKSGGVLKVLVPSKDYGPATKLLPTLQVKHVCSKTRVCMLAQTRMLGSTSRSLDHTRGRPAKLSNQNDCQPISVCRSCSCDLLPCHNHVQTVA